MISHLVYRSMCIVSTLLCSPLLCMTRARRIAAECVATAFLLAAVVGSGIMGDRLAVGNVASHCSLIHSQPAQCSWR